MARRIGRGSTTGAGVTGGGRGRKQRIIGRNTVRVASGRHPGASRGTRRVGG